MSGGTDHLIRSQAQDIARLKGAIEKRDREVERLNADLRATKEALSEVVKSAAGQVGPHDWFVGQALPVFLQAFAIQRPTPEKRTMEDIRRGISAAVTAAQHVADELMLARKP